MAENAYKSNTFSKKDPRAKNEAKKEKGGRRIFLNEPRLRLVFGFFLLLLSVYFFVAFVSYLFAGKEDQSVIEGWARAGILEAGKETSNWLGLYGALLSHFFVFRWLGISAFIIPPLLFLLGFRLVFQKNLVPFYRTFNLLLFAGLWLALLLGYAALTLSGVNEVNFLSGGLGFQMAQFFDALLGWGTLLVLLFWLLIFIIYSFGITKIGGDGAAPKEESFNRLKNAAATPDAAQLKETDPLATPSAMPAATQGTPQEVKIASEAAKETKEKTKPEDIPLTVEPLVEEPEKAAKQLVKAQGLYDPTADLPNFRLPPLELLNEIDSGKIEVSSEELQQHGDRIKTTLLNFGIGITEMKATIGPTVTLYEIVPEAGVKISRIKNLEDDIALSLAALGIRIIAPIPGRGTIGIEVPNKKRVTVSIRSMLSSEEFQGTQMDLPVALGKNISNKVHIIDLAKMPHLLVAGATGQGKSVGLNVILASLLYKKHPSQLKFVLVDPKKVEMSLFSKIERHYLAKLPNTEEAIITDTKKVIYTLNSLCIEMETRYELMKEAGVRYLKEYNAKFAERRLNPESGHRFMPYIILVIDELADLMMTAGKEAEIPIAQLAQLARPIGIHLVVATQRPSVNVITGIIKANFPARLSFRVTSKVDSRTILDTGGAEQLIGQGDMLLSTGSDIIRLQCPFVDTSEVDRVCDYISEQRGYPSAYSLPEEEAEKVDLSERDEKFEEAARVIVTHQQGSTSLIQRKMSLGYNRCGRLIDQLEAAGVVGASEGSKAREVLVKDMESLERLLAGLVNRKNGG